MAGINPRATGWREAQRRSVCHSGLIEGTNWNRGWLPVLNTYRTMCITPSPDFQQILEQVRDLASA